MKLFKSVALLLCAAFNAQASSWVEETVGGEHDYTQEFDWGYVTLICGDQQSADWDVKIDGKRYGPGQEPFDLVLDGVEYREPYELARPETAKQFKEFIGALRSAKQVQLVYGPDQAYELVSDHEQVLPDPKDPDFPCKTKTTLTIPDDTPEPSAVSASTTPLEFKVRVVDYNGYSNKTSFGIEVTSLNDSVVVTDIIGNRGNCKLLAIPAGYIKPAVLPVELAYGQIVTFPVASGNKACEHAFEITVVTNRGNVTFNAN